jgi:hypothetical protein
MSDLHRSDPADSARGARPVGRGAIDHHEILHANAGHARRPEKADDPTPLPCAILLPLALTLLLVLVIVLA